MIDKQTKQIIESTINATMDKINSIAVVDRMKAIKEETFKNTEKLLYNYKSLKEHVADEEEYFDMLNKSTSKSIVRYSKNTVYITEDEMLKNRESSFLRSRSDVERIEKAIKKVHKKKEYSVIELRYLTKKEDGETYTYEEIAELLCKDEKTIRTWKNKMIKEIAICLFGTDAI